MLPAYNQPVTENWTKKWNNKSSKCKIVPFRFTQDTNPSLLGESPVLAVPVLAAMSLWLRPLLIIQSMFDSWKGLFYFFWKKKGKKGYVELYHEVCRRHHHCWPHCRQQWELMKLTILQSEQLNLLLNVNKNKELIVDFRKEYGKTHPYPYQSNWGGAGATSQRTYRGHHIYPPW